MASSSHLDHGRQPAGVFGEDVEQQTTPLSQRHLHGDESRHPVGHVRVHVRQAVASETHTNTRRTVAFNKKYIYCYNMSFLVDPLGYFLLQPVLHD